MAWGFLVVIVIRGEILKARKAKRFGIILGTLGRQGSPAMYQHAKSLLDKHGKQSVQFLMAEIQPAKLQMLKQIDVSVRWNSCSVLYYCQVRLSRCVFSKHFLFILQAWVQIACPRLSMDWGSDLPKVKLCFR